MCYVCLPPPKPLKLNYPGIITLKEKVPEQFSEFEILSKEDLSDDLDCAKAINENCTFCNDELVTWTNVDDKIWDGTDAVCLKCGCVYNFFCESETQWSFEPYGWLPENERK